MFRNAESSQYFVLSKEVFKRLGEDIIEKYRIDGKPVKLITKTIGKYTDIDIEDKIGNKIGKIQLRIADHSYNPQNNDLEARAGKFISVVITNNDATKNRFGGKYNLYFDPEKSYEYVIKKINEKIKDILNNWWELTKKQKKLRDI